jgi:S-adenosylmethionine decarboxylase
MKGGSELRALGKHLLVELYGCNPELLKKVDAVRDIMVTATPFGVSGVVVIAESHLSIHTWPEYQYAAVDIFTCGKTIEPEQAVRHIADRFDCPHPSIVEVKRGFISGTGPLRHKVVQGGRRSQGSREKVPAVS